MATRKKMSGVDTTEEEVVVTESIEEEVVTKPIKEEVKDIKYRFDFDSYDEYNAYTGLKG